MPWKCCVFACKTNYRSQQDKTMCGEINKIPVYHFQKNKDNREQWIISVPNANLNVTNNTVICQQQWPSNFGIIEVHGKIHPKSPSHHICTSWYKGYYMWWQLSKSSFFFKLYPTLPEKPWLTEDNKHLLFNYVHLLKNIHNLWLTEKTGELIFDDDDGVRRVAKWDHFKQ